MIRSASLAHVDEVDLPGLDTGVTRAAFYLASGAFEFLDGDVENP